MQKLVFTNSLGESVDLTKAPFGITNWKGLDNTKLTWQTQQVPNHDGSVFIDALMNDRDLSFTVAVQDNNNLELRYQLKYELIQKLNPKLGEGYLVYTNDYLSRRIKVVPQIPLFANKNSNDRGTLKASVVFTANDPYWEDVEETTVEIESGVLKTIANAGDVPCAITATISGIGAKNLTLENKTTEKKIRLSGVADSIIDINTNFGKKSIESYRIQFKDKTATSEFKKVVSTPWVNKFYAITDNAVYCSKYIDKDFVKLGATSYFSDIKFIQNRILLVGNGTLLSLDGETFTRINNYNLSHIEVIKDTIFAFGEDGIYASDDCVNWEKKSNAVISGIIDFSSYYIIIQGNEICSTSDFSSFATEYTGTNDFDAIAKDNNGNIFVTNKYETVKYYYGCTQTATKGGTSLFYDEDKGALIFANLADNGTDLYKIAESTDGATFTEVANDIDAVLADLYKDEFYIAIIKSVGISILNFRYSENLADFTTVFCASPSSKISKGKNCYIGCNNALVLKSEDLERWSVVLNVSTCEFRCVCYSEELDLYIAGGMEGTGGGGQSGVGSIFKSSDLEHWEKVNDYSSGIPLDMIYAEDIHKFIAVGGIPYTDIWRFSATSSDGVNWVDATTPPSAYAESVAYSPDLGIAVATAQFGSVYTTDFDVWVQINDLQSNDTNNVIWNETKKRFELWGNRIFAYSTDGIHYVTKSPSDTVKTKVGGYCKENNTYILTGAFLSSNGFDLADVGNYGGNYIFCDKMKVVINSRYGKYFISDYSKENIIDKLAEESSLDLKLEKGNNEILLSSDNILNFSGTITYRHRYIGV